MTTKPTTGVCSCHHEPLLNLLGIARLEQVGAPAINARIQRGSLTLPPALLYSKERWYCPAAVRAALAAYRELERARINRPTGGKP